MYRTRCCRSSRSTRCYAHFLRWITLPCIRVDGAPLFHRSLLTSTSLVYLFKAHNVQSRNSYKHRGRSSRIILVLCVPAYKGVENFFVDCPASSVLFMRQQNVSKKIWSTIERVLEGARFCFSFSRFTPRHVESFTAEMMEMFFFLGSRSKVRLH